MKAKNYDVWPDRDAAGAWCLHIRKKRGKLSLDEIREVAKDYEQDIYALIVKAMDFDMEQYIEDLDGDFVTLYRADDFFRWRNK